MAFTFCRKNSRGKTWYVGYYVNGKFVRKKSVVQKPSLRRLEVILRPNLKDLKLAF